MIDPKIRIYREYRTYNLLNAKTIEVTERYSMRIDPKQKWGIWVHGLFGHLPNLQITNKKGETLAIMSDQELNQFIHDDNPTQSKEKIFVSQAIFKSLAGDKDLPTGITPTENFTDLSDPRIKHYIAIKLEIRKETFFEEISIKYLKKTSKITQSQDGISSKIELEYVIPHTSINSAYFDIQMNEKYEMLKTPILKPLNKNNIDDKEKKYPWKSLKKSVNKNTIDFKENEHFWKLLEDKKHSVYRIRRKFEHPVKITWKIGIPLMIRLWAWMGLILAASIFISSYFIFNPTKFETFQFIAGSIAGVSALVIGLRVVLFEDIQLMKYWNLIYLSLPIIGIVLIVRMALLTNWP